MRACAASCAVLLCASACAQTEVHRAEIVLAETTRTAMVASETEGAPSETLEFTTYAGFGCADVQDPDEAQHPLSLTMLRAFSYELARAQLSVGVQATFVLDVIQLGGYPRCRGTEILEFCKDHECVPLRKERLCIDLPKQPVDVQDDGRYLEGQRFVKRLTDAFHGYMTDRLSNVLVTSSALDEEVLFRLVGTTETCAELEKKKGFDPTQLLGCSYSCPLVPSAARGEILLDLDNANIVLCESAVRACAGDSFSPDAAGGVEIDVDGQ